MFAPRTRATHDRHRAVVWFQKRGVVPKEGQRGDQLAMQVEDASRDRTRFSSVRLGLRVTLASPASFVTSTDAVNVDFIPFAAMADASA
jgi:hypothetical protein